MCIEWMKSYVKKMEWYDIGLIKLSVFFFTLFLITVWPGFNKLVMNIDWYWFLIVGVIFAGFAMKHKCCKVKAAKKVVKKKK